MKGLKVEDFIKYAKEQFDCDIELNLSSEPDSFEKIFGISFIEKETEIENGFYENVSIDIQFPVNNIVGYSDFHDMELAA